ncbi:MAG: hypothetical protein DRI54_08630 [Bacteroidetes bacterium]|nr:MAG: hypothetical protein DRI54_08630 [Bacteroidota bacterium]
MKYIILILVFNWIAINSSAQNIPNGGFEDVNIDSIFPEMSYPSDWLPYRILIPSIECIPILNQGELTSESHTGNWAIKMKTDSCDIMIKTAGFVTGNTGTFFPYYYSFESNERPESLDFYYKFHREGNDSSFVKILLFKFDTIQSVVSDTIAYTIKYIKEEVGEYSLLTIPIEYVSESNPDFIHIEFGTAKNCSQNQCTPGTTFWVDDVELSGGTLGIEENNNLLLGFKLFPNPSNSIINITVDKKVKLKNIKAYDAVGKLVIEITAFNSQLQIDVSGLKIGMYLLEIETTEGLKEVKQFIVE